MEKNNIVSRTLHFIRTSFFNGLLITLPFTLTVGLIMLAFKILINWLHPAQQFLEHPIVFIANIPYKAILNEIFLIMLGLFLIGALVRLFLLEPLVHAIERMFFRIPLVYPVYSGIKRLVKAFSAQDQVSFQKVVLVEFPRQGVFSIGFLTSELSPAIMKKDTVKLYNIFIPHTPNPASGSLVILSQEDFQEINLTRQEAMAMIISGGIIQPDRFTT